MSSITVWPLPEALDQAVGERLQPGRAVISDSQDLAWPDLVDRLAGARALDPVIERLALWHAAQQAAQGSAWAEVADRPGVLAAIGQAIGVLEQAGIQGAALLRALDQAQDAPAVRERVRYVAGALAAYQAATRPHGLSTRARQAAALARAASSEPGELVIRPRLPWTPADVELVLALAARGRVLVQLPFTHDQPSVTSGVEPALAAFERAHEVAGLELELAPVAGGVAAELVRGVWRKEAPEPVPAPAGVELIEAAAQHREWHALAARLRELVDQGTAPETIWVAAQRVHKVAGPLAAALADVGLLLDDRSGPPLGDTPLGRLVRSVLDVVQGGFKREATLSLLSSRYLAAQLGNQHDDDPRSLVARIRQSGVADLGPAGCEALRRVPAYRRLAQVIEGLLEPLTRLPEIASVSEHVRALTACLNALGVFERARQADLGALHLGRQVDRALARDQAAAQHLENLLAALPQAAVRLSLDRGMERAAFIQLLGHQLGGVRLRQRGVRGGAIRLLPLGQLVGRQTSVVVIPELIDGVTPARGGDGGLFGDDERRLVNQLLGRKLPERGSQSDAGERGPDERLVLLAAMGAARDRLILSWPQRVGERICLPSPLISELLRVAPDLQVSRPPPSPVPAMDQVRSAGALLARVALEVHADPSLRLSPAESEAAVHAGYAAAEHRLGPRLERLAQACDIERRRWRFFSGQAPPHEFVGGLGLAIGSKPPGTVPDAPLSASDVDTLGNCGFRFFAQRLLGVGEADEPGAAPEPRDLGTVAHRALERFWSARIERQAPMVADGEARAELAARLDDALAEYDAKDPAGHPTLWLLERGKLLEKLWRLVERDMQEADQHQPAQVELGFGLQAAPYPAVEIGGLWVAGRLDRVDRLAGGGLLVLDYKTGILKAQEDKIKPGNAGIIDLQLPLYVHAARSLMKHRVVDGKFISLANVAATRGLAAAHADLGGMEALLDETLPRRVAELADKLRAGELTVAPRDCAYCPVRTACRVVHLELQEEEE